MVDPRVIHSITIEMCTGFLLLSGIAIISKLAADTWLRRLRGHVARFDRWAENVSKFAEPASYFALTAGVLATFVSMGTGSMAWPLQDLITSPIVHNKILTTAASQALFIGALLLRTRYKAAIWSTRITALGYSLTVLTGVALMTLQNSIAGHLAGKGSLLDDLLHSLSIDSHVIWVFPPLVSVLLLVAFPSAAIAVFLGLRSATRRAEIPAAA